MLGYWQNFAVSNMVSVQTAVGTMTIKVDGKLFPSDFLLGNEILGTAGADDDRLRDRRRQRRLGA